MDKLIILEACDEGTCCCLTPRSAVVFVSIISLLATFAEVFLDEGGGEIGNEVGGGAECVAARQHVCQLRATLLALFQKANILLLLGAIVENALLVQIYVWYALGFTVLGLVVSIVDFVFRFHQEGVRSLVAFVTEVALLFVTFRCLPLVDLYRKHLEGT